MRNIDVYCAQEGLTEEIVEECQHQTNDGSGKVQRYHSQTLTDGVLPVNNLRILTHQKRCNKRRGSNDPLQAYRKLVDDYEAREAIPDHPSYGDERKGEGWAWAASSIPS